MAYFDTLSLDQKIHPALQYMKKHEFMHLFVCIITHKSFPALGFKWCRLQAKINKNILSGKCNYA